MVPLEDRSLCSLWLQRHLTNTINCCFEGFSFHNFFLRNQTQKFVLLHFISLDFPVTLVNLCFLTLHKILFMRNQKNFFWNFPGHIV